MAQETVRRDPLEVFAPFFNLSRPLNRVIEGLEGERGDRMVMPAMDVVETEEHLTISTELPGMKKDAVKITIENGVLTISGEKTFEKDETKRDFHRVERRFGSFRRSVTLPRELDANQAEASFEDGVLTIRIPRSEAAKPKQLEIR